ncbi:MAG: phosphoenolpyruvate synthase [Candidatus Lokiarchaeota archaeon]|nr:phosphoenolpyruvate synthase [Candidatus Lokiarchaeota archaeon]
MVDKKDKFILWFDECSIEDVPLVGGKNASLGEMIQKTGVPIPYGFALTSYAYRHFIRENKLENFIRETLKDLKSGDTIALEEKGLKIRDSIEMADFPKDLNDAIIDAYKKLGEKAEVAIPDCAVRSSATAEDLPDASFAGQQDTYLHIRGEDAILRAAKRCMASLFTNRAINYRIDKGFDHFEVALSVGVQIMARSDIGASGVIFSIDPETGFDKVVYITAAYGLGEMVVQGKINPDQYYVFKPTLGIISKNAGYKDEKLVYDEVVGVKEVPVPEDDRYKLVLNDQQIKELAKYTIEIEKHYGRKMDIEWAYDGEQKKLFIVQARPETVHSIAEKNILEFYKLQVTEEEKKEKLLLTGEAVGRKIGQGVANVIGDIREIHTFKEGEILVTGMTDPDWEPIMKKARAIITDKGGRTCHAAIISRELGIPCVIGTGNATGFIKDGQKVTVDGSEGMGRIFNGLLPYEIEKIDVSEVPKTKTKIFMNVGIPEQAFDQAKLPADGVGLARLEFIINSHIQIHPLALIHINDLKDYLRFRQYESELLNIMIKIDSVDVVFLKEEIDAKIDKIVKIRETIEKISEMTPGYEDKAQFFISKLAEGLARIAAAFYPGDVIVRLSDFKTNEYANLIGGFLYEPDESNPMIGLRGSSRYYADWFLPAFRLECHALKHVRDDMGLTNVKIMVPFCRTPEEGKRIIEIMREEGLEQGKNGLEIYVMAEIPSNIILVDEFAEIFDGFSIGSNDLTQLTLGLDRDSEQLLPLFDERNKAVTNSIKKLIEGAKKKGRKTGICGQSPSDYPSIAAFLVKNGIESISLNPDTIIATRAFVKVVEWALENNKEYDKLLLADLVKIPGINEGLAKTVLAMIEKEQKINGQKAPL